MVRKVISAVGLTIMCSVIYAQETPSPKSLERSMNSKVIDVIMRLEEVSDMSSGQDCREFLQLFESEDSPVVCDLFSSADFLKQVPVSKYAGYYVNDDNEPEFSALTYEFHDIRKHGWSYDNGIWTCYVSFRKTLSYFDGNMIYFPLLEQVSGDAGFEMYVSIAFDESCSNCLISSMSCQNVPDFRKLDEEYYIIQKNEDPVDAKRDEEIFFDGAYVRYNEFGQAYAPKKEFIFVDDDVLVTKNMINSTDRYEHVQFKYKPRRFRLRLRNEFAPLSAYRVSAPDGTTVSSFAYNGGLDVGYSIPVSIAFKLGIYTGLGVTYSRMSLESLPVTYSYKLSSPLGDYVRNYNISNISQEMRFVDLTVPIYITPEFRIHRLVSILFDLGVKIHFNTSTVLSPLHLEGNVSGVYENGGPVQSGDYGIGNVGGDYSEFVSMDGVRRKPIDISLMGSVGLDVSLYARTLYLQVRAGYEYGLTQSYNSQGRIFADPESGIYPLVWDGAFDREVAFRPLADCVSFWRRSFWFSLGIMVKL